MGWRLKKKKNSDIFTKPAGSNGVLEDYALIKKREKEVLNDKKKTRRGGRGKRAYSLP